MTEGGEGTRAQPVWPDGDNTDRWLSLQSPLPSWPRFCQVYITAKCDLIHGYHKPLVNSIQFLLCSSHVNLFKWIWLNRTIQWFAEILRTPTSMSSLEHSALLHCCFSCPDPLILWCPYLACGLREYLRCQLRQETRTIKVTWVMLFFLSNCGYLRKLTVVKWCL